MMVVAALLPATQLSAFIFCWLFREVDNEYRRHNRFFHAASRCQDYG
jgi:hypothetical protein